MNHLEEFISKLYKTIDIHTPEQLVSTNIAEKLSIGLYYWDEKSQAAITNNKRFIFLDITMLSNFEWETFCHELCHLLLHAGDQTQLPSSFVEYQERKANNFALHAAVPTFMLKEIDLPNNYFQAVRILQETFKVSFTFACKRLDHYINNHLRPFHIQTTSTSESDHHN